MFFEKTDWSLVNSNVERLSYLARQLKLNTTKPKPPPVSEEELFTFAQEDGWRDRLDPDVLSAVKALLDDYKSCLSRIRACRAEIRNNARGSDISRILFARNQEDDY